MMTPKQDFGFGDCHICGAQYKKITSRSRFCSEKCRTTFFNNLRITKYPKLKKGETKICAFVYCKVEFVPNTVTQKYCSLTCVDKAYKKRLRVRRPEKFKVIKAREYQRNKKRYDERSKAYRKKYGRKENIETVRACSRRNGPKYQKKQIEGLTDQYIKGLLSAHGTPRKDWPKEFIDLKRLEIKAKRLIKQLL